MSLQQWREANGRLFGPDCVLEVAPYMIMSILATVFALLNKSCVHSMTSSFSSGVGMRCKSCGSIRGRKFTAEMGIHFPGLKNIDKPVVWVFPELVVCLDCGFSEFAMPEAELGLLAKGEAAASP